MEVRVHEVVPKCGSRTEFGRVVVSPPKVRGPLKLREGCRFMMCCNRAFLTEESYKKHQSDSTEHGAPLDFSKFPKPPPPPLRLERKVTNGSSGRQFWVHSNNGGVDKAFEVNEDNSELDLSFRNKDRLTRVTVVDVNNAGNGRGWKKCTICNLSTSKMSRHLEICHAGGAYKCHYCPCSFISDKRRGLHQRRMHRIQALPSPSRKQNIIAGAEKQLIVSTLVPKDIRYQLEESRVPQCPICKKMCSSMYVAREHLNSHYGVKHKCDLCEMSFYYSSSLRRHEKTVHSRSHTRQRLRTHQKYAHLKKFGRNLNEVVSVKMRTELTTQNVDDQSLLAAPLNLQCPPPNTSGMYECHICSKQLSSPQAWRGHMLIHQNLKPHKCELCTARFRLHSTRFSHMKTSHTNGPFKCSRCPCSFNSLRPFQRHFRLYHVTRKSINSGANNTTKVQLISNEMKDISDIQAFNQAVSRCNLCGVTYDNLADFNNHKLLHTNAPRRTCNLCLKSFANVQNFTMHKTRAHGNGTYSCPVCSCRYQTTAGLFRHLTVEHGMLRNEWNFKEKRIKPEAIIRIQISLSQSGTLTISKSLPEKAVNSQIIEETSTKVAESLTLPMFQREMVECDLCHLKVGSTSLRAHKMKSHFHDGKYKCVRCSCKFKVLQGLMIHCTLYHGHVGKRKARQVLARAKLKLAHPVGPKLTSQDLQVNMAHNDDLSYMCTFCEEVFQDQSSFRKHVEIHQAGLRKQFECDLCNMRFTHKSSILHHKRKSHFHSGTIQCSKCSCKFLTEGGLTNHKKVHHGYVATGNRSRKSLFKYRGTSSVIKKDLSSLLKHKYVELGFQKDSTNRFQCSFCAKTLGSQAALNLHLAIHTRNGKRKYQCNLCHMKFLHPHSVNHHKRRCHNHDGVYNCSNCSCKFLTKGGLLNHQARFHGAIGKKKQRKLQKKLTAEANLNEVNEGLQSTAGEDESCSNEVNKPSRSSVECQICLLQIHAKTKMGQHLQNCHHHDGTYQCSFCTCKFKTGRGLGQHKLKYHGAGGTSASKFKKLLVKSHTKTSQQVSTFTKAQKVLRKTKQLRVTTANARVTCNICGCNFSRKAILAKHEQVAHTNGQYKCKYCNCCFHHAAGLTKHTAWHETGRTNTKKKREENVSPVSNGFSQNEIAHGTFGQSSKNSKNHDISRFNLNFLKVRGSYSSKLFVTSNVSKSPKKKKETKQKELLQTERIPLSPPKLPHSPVKYRFQCDQCGIKFSHKIYLDRHSTKAHIVGGIACDECPCTFATSITLAAHKRVYHNLLQGTFRIRKPNSAVTSSSPRRSPSQRKEQNDYTTSPGNLEKCNNDSCTAGGLSVGSLMNARVEKSDGETSDSSASAIKRIKLSELYSKVSSKSAVSKQQPEPELQFKCNSCGKSFSTTGLLNRHILSHTRPEQCPKCNLRFRCKEEVLKHIKTHHGKGQFQCSSCSCRFEKEKGRKIHFYAIHVKQAASASVQSSAASNQNSFTEDSGYVIEHEEDDEDDDSYFEADPSLSGTGDNDEFDEESTPVVQGIIDANYSSDFANEEVNYVENTEDDTVQDALEGEHSDESDPIIQRIVYEGDQSNVVQQSSSSSLSTKTSASQNKTSFSPKSRPIKCGTCGITCYGPETLRLHMESHKEPQEDDIGEEAGKENSVQEMGSVKCETCGNEFQNEEELAKHSEMEHDETGLYKCWYCPCTMKTETNLRYHFMKHHDMV